MGIKLVSETDPKAIAERREREAAAAAKDELSSAMRCLAANLFRIAAGAGKEIEVVPDIARVANAYAKFSTIAQKIGYSADAVFGEALQDRDWRARHPGYDRPSQTDIDRWAGDGTTAEKMAINAIVKASLRKVAAELVAQPTQESVARNQLHEAIRRFEDVRSSRVRRGRK